MTDDERTPPEPRKLSLRSRVLWWAMVRAERVAGWCRRRVIEIWQKRTRRKP